MAVRSDGTVYIDTLVDTQGFGTGVNTMKKSVGGLTSAFGKLGVTIAAAFSITKLVQFGKEAIDLGSDLEEVQNVVDVTFTTMSDRVDEFAKSAAEAAGLSETMAKRYMGTFGAMSKSFGFMEEEAFAMSSTLTQAVGDVASFYNLTQDEAYTKLKSVFTGETESIKDLGVVMTQSALDSFAMAKGYEKTTKEMSEQEKVALRYSFVLDQLSASSGDFIRTQDSWANQMRILSLSFDTFKANVGQALINIFTPFLKVLNQVVERMVALSESFLVFSEMLFGKQTENATDSLKEIENGYEDVADATNEADKANRKYLTGLDEIQTFKNESGVDQINGVSFNLGMGKTIDEFGTLESKAENFSDEMVKAFEPVQKIIEGFETGDFTITGEGLSDLVATITEIFNKAVESVDWGEIGENAIELLIGIDWIKVADSLINVANTLDDAIYDLFEGAIQTAIDYFLNGEKPPVSDAQLEELGKKYLDWFITTPFSKALTMPFFPTIALIEAIIAGIEEGKESGELSEGVKRFLTALVGLFSYYFTGETSEELTQAISDWFDEKVAPLFSEETWTKAMEGVKEAFKTVFKNAVNGAIEIFNKFIDYINEKMKFQWEPVKILGTEVVPGGNVQLFTIPKIPKLATGAVIPPNAPFMAMLGDQKNGTNIEAPLSTIEQALENVYKRNNGGNGGQYQFTAQINRRTLFDEVIAEANLRQITTGRNPFELA